MTQRTTYVGLVNESMIGQTLTLQGWVQKRRDLGKLIFVDLRDREGICQIVFDSEILKDQMRDVDQIRTEYIIEVTGELRYRSEDAVNLNHPTGKMELVAKEFEILTRSKVPAIYIEDDLDASEEVRLKYRYLDLRRPKMFKNLKLRHQVVQSIRNFLNEAGFIDVETPFLTKSTPEGARDYLVPTRREAGEFYALPQSPQLFKQLLMAAGFDRYYQIVRCFRDEDLRGDRQPEFTQVDLETSFLTQAEIQQLAEAMIKQVMREVMNIEFDQPFPTISYAEAMARFGVDKPDIRFDLELRDVTEWAEGCEFGVFKNTVTSGGVVQGINLKGLADEYSRKTADALADVAKPYGAKGLAWVKLTDEGLNGPIAKFFDEKDLAVFQEKLALEEGDIVFFVADQLEVTQAALGALRNHLGKVHQLYDEDEFAFIWVVDWPLLEYDEESKRYVAMHHPFTSPQNKDIEALKANPKEALANAYDIVLNGYELGGGSVRINDKALQDEMFSLLGFTPEQAQSQFGFLLDAMEYGFPPHGGIALGLDRFIMLLAKEPNIREVIAFPKTGRGYDVMMEAPNHVAQDQLDELHLTVKKD